MKKRFMLVTATLFLAASAAAVTSSTPAIAQVDVLPSFTGTCTFTGTSTFTSPIGITASATGFSFSSNTKFAGGAANRCSGTLNDAPIADAPASVIATGSGSLSCGISQASGSGTLTINGVPVGFTLTITGVGPTVLLVVTGKGGGTPNNAAGVASFAIDTTAAQKCAANSALSLDFAVAAAGAIN